ncbi:MAG: pseudouridine synthase, partial [Verrucomicrobiota bacterium]
MRLEQLIAKRLTINKRDARLKIASGKVIVNNAPLTDGRFDVDAFTKVTCEGVTVQPSRERIYLMLNKPKGTISATTDPVHQTVLDLIDHPLVHELHLTGRLDRSSTGLILLTNDSKWSRQMSHPDEKLEKVYLV